MHILIAAGVGAGKTTIALNIQRVLEDCGIPCILTDDVICPEDAERMSQVEALRKIGEDMQRKKQFVQIITLLENKKPSSKPLDVVESESLLEEISSQGVIPQDRVRRP